MPLFLTKLYASAVLVSLSSSRRSFIKTLTLGPKPIISWSYAMPINARFLSVISLAPGHIKSKMQDYILTVDSQDIPSVKKFQETYENMPSPKIVAENILLKIDKILSFESGSFVDLRDI